MVEAHVVIVSQLLEMHIVTARCQLGYGGLTDDGLGGFAAVSNHSNQDDS